jgi:hypothetical protein
MVHTEQSSTMRRVSNTSTLFFLFAALVFWIMPHSAHGESSKSDHDIWKTFSLGQKRYALFGFIDCHKRLFQPPNATRYNADDRTFRRVDELSEKSTKPMGELILEAMKGISPAPPDVHAEHGSVDDGMLWRGLIEQEKQAYVQGVFWCAVNIPATKIRPVGKSVGTAVKALDDWYVVSDDDWKDPRSNTRVNVPGIVAMQRTEIISIKRTKAP